MTVQLKASAVKQTNVPYCFQCRWQRLQQIRNMIWLMKKTLIQMVLLKFYDFYWDNACDDFDYDCNSDDLTLVISTLIQFHIHTLRCELLWYEWYHCQINHFQYSPWFIYFTEDCSVRVHLVNLWNPTTKSCMTCSQMKQTRKKRHDLLAIPRNLQNSSTIQEYKTGKTGYIQRKLLPFLYISLFSLYGNNVCLQKQLVNCSEVELSSTEQLIQHLCPLSYILYVY